MADNTLIEWCDATCNAVNGCSVLSPGCTNCYAMKLAGTRLKNHPSRAGLTQLSKAGPVWTGEVRLNEDQLLQPLRWKRPRRIFWNAHGDLFHENVPEEWIDRVFAVCALTPQHTHMILTKRPERMREYLSDASMHYRVALTPENMQAQRHSVETMFRALPLTNVWLGTSAEDQTRADERIPHLLATPAAKRFVSLEPLLEAINMRDWLRPLEVYEGGFRDDLDAPSLDWVIAGGESGPGARPMHPDWVRSLRNHCIDAEVPFFFKQWGSWLPWEPEHGPCWKAQDGRSMDRHCFPDFSDADLRGWSDTLLYEGDDICVHEHVGKKAAGRLLDGRLHSEFPA